MKITFALFALLSLRSAYVSSFFLAAKETKHQRLSSFRAKQNANSDKGGYKFGDLTRSLLKKASTKAKEITGKDDYSFGDVSRKIDDIVKQRIAKATGKGDYQVGDLTNLVKSSISERLSNYTGNETYQFGDLSKALVRKVRSGEYTLDDVLLALRVLLAAGASLLPIARLLPINALLQLFNLGLAQQVSERVMDVLARAIDARMKEALTGDPEYALGDITKRKLGETLANFTGKESYEFGDISRKISSLGTDPAVADLADLPVLEFSDTVAEELGTWDKRFQKTLNPEAILDETDSASSNQATSELSDWDKRFLDKQIGDALK